MFDKVKQLYELKKQADQLKKELEKEIIEVENSGYKVKINANVKILEIETPSEIDNSKLRDVLNKAIEEVQKEAAKKMQGMMGGLGGLQDLLKG